MENEQIKTLPSIGLKMIELPLINGKSIINSSIWISKGDKTTIPLSLISIKIEQPNSLGKVLPIHLKYETNLLQRY